MMRWMICGLAACAMTAAQAAEVKLEKVDGGARLLRDGQPYFIKGAGGKQRLAELAACGGNSIRT